MKILQFSFSHAFKGLAVFLIFRNTIPPAIALPAKDVGKIAQEVTVTVLIDDRNFGSGVLLNRQGNIYTVLTAEHVVKETMATYQVITPDQVSHPVNTKTLKKVPGVDLAIVQFSSNRPYPIVKIGNSDSAVIGSVVYVAGFPLPGRAIKDREFTFTTGQISARPARAQADGYALVYTNVTRRGMSGGPVIDIDGRLVGIHGRAESDEEVGSVKAGLNLGIPINTFSQIAQTMGLNFKTTAATPTTPTSGSATATPSLPISQSDLDNVSPAAFQDNPELPPVLRYRRPEPIRPSTGSLQPPVCAGSSC